MPGIERQEEVFIVRMWREPREIPQAGVVWRCVIEHVPSGEQQAVIQPDGILLFMQPHIEQMGVSFGWGWRLRQWLAGKMSDRY